MAYHLRVAPLGPAVRTHVPEFAAAPALQQVLTSLFSRLQRIVLDLEALRW